jgi:hypothetical protein
MKLPWLRHVRRDVIGSTLISTIEFLDVPELRYRTLRVEAGLATFETCVRSGGDSVVHEAQSEAEAIAQHEACVHTSRMAQC